jgi:glycosyltransferase involved in cell wall biosynthesis
MNARPLVSVIVPAFNAAAMIAETLESILAQTYDAIELIVVDDGSTDDTASVARSYIPRLQYVRQPNNSGGAAVPRNTGLERSNGEFLAFMDADDLMTPDRLERQVDFLQRHPQVGVVFSDYQNVSDNGGYPTSHFSTCPKLSGLLGGREEAVLNEVGELLAEENFGITSAFLMRRSLLDSVPRFEPTLHACEDFHFYYRLARHTPVGLINRIGMLRRIHGSNMSGDPVRMFSAGTQAYSMLLEDERDAAARAALARYIARCWSDWARLEANNRRTGTALRYYARAISRDSSPRHVRDMARGMVRALAIAAGLHQPDTR